MSIVSAPLFQLRISVLHPLVEARPRRANANQHLHAHASLHPESAHDGHTSHALPSTAAEWMSSALPSKDISTIDRIGETEMDDRRDTSTRAV